MGIKIATFLHLMLKALVCGHTLIYICMVLIKLELLIIIKIQRGHEVGGRRGGTLGSWKDIVVGDQYTLYKCIQLSKKKNMFLRSPSLDLLIEPFL